MKMKSKSSRSVGKSGKGVPNRYGPINRPTGKPKSQGGGRSRK